MAERCELQTNSEASGAGLHWAWFSSKFLQQENTKLRSALAEATARATRQAMLTREADHRIKNSLQIVASLVRGSARGGSPAAAVAVNAAALRIDEIANLHDLLQLSPGGDLVDLGALLHRMRRSIETVISIEPRRIEVLLEAGPIMAPPELARSVMMTVSELVTNSIRHAFPGERCGTIRISAAVVGGSFRLVVADDGVGLLPEPAKGPGFGMTLVRAMARQIGGDLVAEHDRGARFTLVAPLSVR